MPVENERKYVLGDPQGILRESLKANLPRHYIEQVYTPAGGRFRKIEQYQTWERDGYDAPREDYIFTFKEDFSGKTLEIETEVDPVDYQMARDGSTRVFNKIRYKLEFHDYTWDVDFFLTKPLHEGGEVYFAMAECEYDSAPPSEVATLLKNYLLLIVPETHNSVFSSFKLCDQDYARTVVAKYRAGEFKR